MNLIYLSSNFPFQSIAGSWGTPVDSHFPGDEDVVGSGDGAGQVKFHPFLGTIHLNWRLRLSRCRPLSDLSLKDKFLNGSLSFSLFLLFLFTPCMPAKLLQLCTPLCYPMDWSLPGPSVRGILLAKILKWVAMLFSRGSSWPRDWTCISSVPCIGKQVLYH